MRRIWQHTFIMAIQIEIAGLSSASNHGETSIDDTGKAWAMAWAAVPAMERALWYKAEAEFYRGIGLRGAARVTQRWETRERQEADQAAEKMGEIYDRDPDFAESIVSIQSE